MRVSVKLSKKENEQFDTFKNEPLIRTNKTAIRMVIALGLQKMADGDRLIGNGNEILRFNTATIDPEGVFEVVAYYIISNRLGASINKKKVIVANKEEIAEIIAEAFKLGLKEVQKSQWLDFFINKSH